MTKQTGAAAVASVLAQAGIRRAFGIPGQRILPLFHEMANEHGIPVVLTRHEQGAAFMADMHARLGGIGCCLATSGPGAINLLTGLAASYMDSVPVLALTAQAATHEFGRYGIQEGTGIGRTPDIRAMFASTTKGSFQPTSVEQLIPDLSAALRLATEGRPGPVHVDIPSDLLLDLVPERIEPSPAAETFPAAAAVRATEDELRALDAAVRQARRPLLLIGNGVARSGALDDALALARSRDMAVAGTFLAKSVLDETDPRVLGPVGVFGTRAANEAFHHEADLVVALGVAFTYLSTAGWPDTLRGDRVVRINNDRRELEANAEFGQGILGDAADVVRRLAALPPGPAAGGLAWATDMRRRLPDQVEASRSTALHPVTVCETLNRHLDHRTTVVADIGQNAYWGERHLRTRGDNRFIINGGLGTMGHAVAGATGAWMARADEHPDEHVICVCGDGGFMMGALEISTAVAERADVTWVIFNNGTLGTQRAWFEREGHPVVAADLPPTDHVLLARSLGAHAETVRTADELDTALRAARATGGPSVLDVLIDPCPVPEAYQP
ncbi:thiamine pyrophosphate-binding protein [Streptomyces sp. NBC_01166]|uniref:thiamine pyrophosphate-binding protein n=1 Tax=Streptomyces sp. NBC_01166 TaxID=2903755 RepID=UPI00386CEC52|nr:thiamine pyrophosphate-binding protein [Streptomyces sp. NBC_01166]